MNFDGFYITQYRAKMETYKNKSSYGSLSAYIEDCIKFHILPEVSISFREFDQCILTKNPGESPPSHFCRYIFVSKTILSIFD